MYRRRRPKREIAFSFDSFLDVVANVCGIIIRLILVAWVGARSYHTVMARQTLQAPEPTVEIVATKPTLIELPPVTDPLEAELRKQREELAQQQQRLLEQLRQCQLLENAKSETSQQVSALTKSEAVAERERNAFVTEATNHEGITQTAHLSLAEITKRTQQLTAELQELERLPPLKKTLRYRTPVSRPVHSEELHFECQGGKVGFIDLQAFLIEIRRGIEDKGEQLKTRWEFSGTAGPVGAYRLRYTLERERGLLESGGQPSAGAYRYGMSGWVVEPIISERGETAKAALSPNGEFRRLVEAIDPEQTVVTMWVYPDSFELYRQLRDFLHEHNIEVAGRPLPPGTSIASSRQGSASRGQ